jgi:hypothetical protein
MPEVFLPAETNRSPRQLNTPLLCWLVIWRYRMYHGANDSLQPSSIAAPWKHSVTCGQFRGVLTWLNQLTSHICMRRTT